MLMIILFSFVGLILGIVAGILPGIHSNQFFVLLISMLPLLSGYPTSALLALVLTTATSNIMFNYIPSIFFSVPDSSTVVNVLPGHRMVLEGKGLDALFISLLGAFVTFTACAISLPILLYLIPIMHSFFYPYLHIMLIGLTGWMIFMEGSRRKMFLSLSLYAISGVWGILTLNSTMISSDWALFPTLTGMFGMAGLLMSMKDVQKLPAQAVSDDVETGSMKKIIASGLIAGLLIGILPGAGESQAGVLVSEFTGLSQKEFLGALAGINASNLFFSIVSLYSFGKIRSGAGAAIDQVMSGFGLRELVFSVGVIMFSAGASVLLTWLMGKKMLKMLEGMNYKLISGIIMIFTFVMVLWFTGFVGTFMMIVSTCIGLLSVLCGVKRTSCMGYLMIPTIIYFSGLTHVINSLLS